MNDIIIPIITAFIGAGGVWGFKAKKENVKTMEIDNFKNLMSMNDLVIQQVKAHLESVNKELLDIKLTYEGHLKTIREHNEFLTKALKECQDGQTKV